LESLVDFHGAFGLIEKKKEERDERRRELISG
jgi:hypothetical protein